MLRSRSPSPLARTKTRKAATADSISHAVALASGEVEAARKPLQRAMEAVLYLIEARLDQLGEFGLPWRNFHRGVDERAASAVP